MKRFATHFFTAILLAFITLTFLGTPISFALNDLTIQSGAESARGNSQPVDMFGAAGVFTTITNVLLFVIGALSVIMLIIGGLRYVVSGGNTTAVTSAKNTILYAVIGIIVALLAYAVIHFVISSFSVSASGGTTL